MNDASSGVAQNRRLLLALALAVMVMVAGIVALDRPLPDPPQAAAAPPTSTSTSEAQSTTEVPVTVVETLPLEAPPVTLPPPHPGPPVWPTTGAAATGKSITIYDAPYGTPERKLDNPFGAMPSRPAFRVLGVQGGWLHVQTPYRPNGSTGWIKTTDVQLFQTNVSVDVDIAAHFVTVYDGDRVAFTTMAAVGTPYTPSPTGEFYITDLIANPGGAYGTYALGLSAHSNVLSEFHGGDGQVALHGTNQPWFVGLAISNGCIRLPNEIASRLGSMAGYGVPVRIHNG